MRHFLLPKFLGDNKGQVLLTVVLVMVVSLTVGLALVSRSITNLRSTTDESYSESAFGAAESGIEQALKLNKVGNNVISNFVIQSSSNGNTITAIKEVDVSLVSGNSILLSDGYPVFQDDGADVWLTSYTGVSSSMFQSPYYNGNLNIYWGESSNGCNEAALEIIVISGSRVSPSLTKYAVDPCSRGNGFSTATSLDSGSGPVTMSSGDLTKTFHFGTQISITNGLIARIIPLYANASIGVSGTNLPNQGEFITSTGASGTTGKQVLRKINFFRGYPELPSEFYYNLFTPKP